MKIKKLLVMSLLVLMVLGCIGSASAGWFDFLSGTSNINGVEFKIPEGFEDNSPKEEDTSTEDNSDDVPTANFVVEKNYVEKLYTKSDENCEAGVSRIYINVYNNSDNEMKLPDEGTDNADNEQVYSGSMSDIEEQMQSQALENSYNITWNSKEISGHEGMLASSDITIMGDKIYNYEFDYIEGNKYIKIYVNDLSVLDELLSK